jgi:molybdate transport system substrate-binding protein
MQRILAWISILVLFCGARIELACAAEAPADLVVFAAASLTDSLEEIGAAYEKRTGQRVVFNFGASNLLARQIREGAPADLFLSADEARMDELEREGLLLPGTRKSVLSNSLVVVVPQNSTLVIAAPADLARPGLERLVLAEPSSVPAGIYAREWLQSKGLWSSLSDRIVPTENVRAALAAIEAGNADAGIVYETDAAISRKVKVAFEVPAAEGPAISYPFAVLRRSTSPDAARRLLDYLVAKEALDVFRRFGFPTRI